MKERKRESEKTNTYVISSALESSNLPGESKCGVFFAYFLLLSAPPGDLSFAAVQCPVLVKNSVATSFSHCLTWFWLISSSVFLHFWHQLSHPQAQLLFSAEEKGQNWLLCSKAGAVSEFEGHHEHLCGVEMGWVRWGRQPQVHCGQRWLVLKMQKTGLTELKFSGKVTLISVKKSTSDFKKYLK